MYVPVHTIHKHTSTQHTSLSDIFYSFGPILLAQCSSMSLSLFKRSIGAALFTFHQHTGNVPVVA